MIDLNAELLRQARVGEREYGAIEPPEGYVSAYVSGMRSFRRRRRVRRMTAVAVLAMVVAWGAVETLPRRAEPAGHVPGASAWTTNLGSESWSSPALLGDTTVVVAADDGVIRGLDLESGVELWQVRTDADIRSAIHVHDGLAYVASEDGSLYAVDLQGRLVWRTAVYEPITAHDAETPMSSGPLVTHGIVYVGDRSGVMHAIDAQTGIDVWTAQLGGAITSQAGIDGDLLVVGAGDAKLYALDALTGAERWTAPLGGEVATAPAVAEGVVVSGSRGTYVIGFDADSGAELWRVSMGTSWAESSPVIEDGRAYVGSSLAGQVVSIDLHSGVPLWRSQVGGMPWARPAVAGSTIYATSVGTGDPFGQSPALSALDLSSGRLIWSAPTGSALQWALEPGAYGAATEPLIVGDFVVVTGLDGVVRAFWR